MYTDPDLNKMTLYGGCVVRKVNGKKQDFFEDFYSYEGGYMPAKIYYREKAKGRAHTQIWMDYGRKYSDDFTRMDARDKHTFKITSMNELAEFILNSDLVTLDEVRAIREGRARCKTIGDYISLFPETYQAILRMRHLYDLHKAERVEKEMESLEETISRGYNADAFIESE